MTATSDTGNYCPQRRCAPVLRLSQTTQQRGRLSSPAPYADCPNPLDDVAALRSFDALVHDGRYRPRKEIDSELETLRAVYAADLEYLRRFTPDGPAPVLDAIAESAGSARISEAGFRSLIWIYMKFGNLEAAASVAEALQEMYPSETSTANVAYIHELLAGM